MLFNPNPMFSRKGPDIITQRQESERRDNLLRHELIMPDEGNMAVFKAISNADPKYAKHLTQANELVMLFARHLGGGIELLEQPVCRSCEGVGTWDAPDSKGNPRGYCFGCNVHTTNPITVSKYLLEQVKGMDDATLEMLTKAARKEEIYDSARIEED